MKALQLEKPASWRQIDLPEPPPPEPTEALVRVHRVGICGTDISIYRGKMPFFTYPRIPGHELGAEVVAVGSAVTGIKPGDHCSIEPYLNCQDCYACRRGHSNCCERNQVLGVHCDGGLRPLFTVPARKLHLSSILTFEQLALVETLAIGCHAVNRASLAARETVLVIGAGPIGLSVIEFARLTGARVIVMDINPQRLDFCRSMMGIQDTLLSAGDGGEGARLAAMTDGRLADVVIDATGSSRSMAQSLTYCAFAGRVVYVGLTQEEISVPHASLMHRRELTILASRNALPADFKRIIELIEEGQINTTPWITHRVAFDELPAAFPKFLLPETGAIKAMVTLP